jgi:16S rRNA G966 N2-methylase RsmD
MSYIQKRNIILNKLFHAPPNNNYRKLKIDLECMSYITTPQDSDQIVAIINSNLNSNNDICIFDGTGGVGGDAIAFGRNFNTVITTEIDQHRFDMLVNNVLVFELYNVISLNCSCLDIMEKINFIDVAYFDPPWGGKTYKKFEKLRLKIGDLYIDEIVNRLFDPQITRSNIKMIVFKLPNNYDLESLYKNTKHNQLTVLMYQLNKMMIIVFKKHFYSLE